MDRAWRPCVTAILSAVLSVVLGQSQVAKASAIAFPLAAEIPHEGGTPPQEAELQWGGQRIVRNVSRPSLLAYPADPAHNTGIAVVIAPGGGFRFLAIDREGRLVAEWLNRRGINAFVLKYRLEKTPRSQWAFSCKMMGLFAGAAIRTWLSNAKGLPQEPLSPVQEDAINDGLRAIEWVRSNAGRWHIETDAIGILGFSAGGAVATGVAKKGRDNSRPDFAASIYGVPATGGIPNHAPPLFLATADDDPIVPAQWSQALHALWLDSGHDSTIRRFSKGGHGFGMKPQGTLSDYWIDHFYDWLTLVLNPAIVSEKKRNSASLPHHKINSDEYGGMRITNSGLR